MTSYGSPFRSQRKSTFSAAVMNRCMMMSYGSPFLINEWVHDDDALWKPFPHYFHSISLIFISVLHLTNFYITLHFMTKLLVLWCHMMSLGFDKLTHLHCSHNGHDGMSNHQPHQIVYSTIYSKADQRKHQSSASLAFVQGIQRWPVNSPHKRPVTQKMFPFDDVIMWTHLPLDKMAAK